MPALPDYPNVLRIDFSFQVGEDLQARCRLHCKWSGTTPSNATCALIATDLTTAFQSKLRSLLSSHNALLAIEVTDLTSPTGGSGSDIATMTGTRGGTALPGMVAALVNQPFARRYRGGKSRTYWPFLVVEDLLTEQHWLAVTITEVDTQFQLFADDVVAISEGGTLLSGGFVSISYYHGFTAVTNPITGRTRDVPLVRAAAIAPDLIEAFNLNSRPGTQRRRALHSS